MGLFLLSSLVTRHQGWELLLQSEISTFIVNFWLDFDCDV